MAQFKITDPDTGVSLKLTGDKPPSSEDIDLIFAKHYKKKGVAEKPTVATQKAPVEAASTEGSLLDTITDNIPKPVKDVVSGAEYVANLATSMVAKPVSDIAGLAATAKDIVTGNINSDASGFRDQVRDDLTYHPETDAAKALATSNLNPLNLFANAIHGIANFTASFGEDEAGDSALGMISNGIREGVIQAPIFIGAKMSSSRLKRTKQKALELEKSRNAVLDTARNEAQAKGFVTPAESGVKVHISGVARTNKALSQKNAATATDLIKKELGLPLDEAINPAIGGNLDALKTAQYKVYSDIVADSIGVRAAIKKTVPNARSVITGKNIQRTVIKDNVILPTKAFKDTMNKHIAEAQKLYKDSPKANAGMKGAIDLFKEQLAKKTQDPVVMFENIKSMRRDAKTIYSRQSSPKQMKQAHAKMAIANALEGLMESHLVKIGKPELMVAFRQARTNLAKINTVETAINPVTGVIDIKTLSNLSKKKGAVFTGELKAIADFGTVFPDAAASLTGAPTYLSLFDTALAGASVLAGHPRVAAVEVGGRLGIPALGKTGLLQNKTPSYKASNLKPKLFTGAAVTTPSNNRNTP
jgi:hypothetical protein